MTAQTADQIPLTVQERHILHRYGRGEDVATIATALRLERQPVGDLLIDLCGLDRNRAKEAVRRGTKPAGARVPPVKRERRSRNAPAVISPEPLARVAWVPAPIQVPAVGTVVEAPEPVEPSSCPLERWASNRCPACKYVGPVGEHPTRCDGRPVPVTIVVLPEVACA